MSVEIGEYRKLYILVIWFSENMKILFIMPSLDNGYWKKLGKKVGPRSEPLSLLYLATFLNNNGHEAFVLDCAAEGISLDELRLKLEKGNYDVVGVALLTAMYSPAVNICKLVKKINPAIKVIVGGSHASLRPKKTVQDEESIDVVTINEAEFTFLELLDVFNGKGKLEDVQGIAFKDKNGTVVQNKERKKIQDLDVFPIPNRDLINMKLYRPSVSYYKRLPAYTMITTRGCPYRCLFCATSQSGYRMHSIKRVVKEMKILVEKYGSREILMRDDTFTLNRQRTLDLCSAIIDAGLHKKVIWDCITRANLVDYELLKVMKAAGCWGIHFGVEGGTQKLIDNIQKDTNLEVFKAAFRDCKKLGIETRGYFMVGLPGSTREDDLATIKFAKELNPDWAQFTITTPYPGTQLFDEAEKWGKFNTDISDWDKYLTWSGYGDTELVWTAHGRTSQDVKEMQRKAMRSYYFRPGIILGKLKNIDNIKILKKYIIGALALGGR
jgi:anaerobic magnesium-protoporphyrin IX monomethyl ester cyclase